MAGAVSLGSLAGAFASFALGGCHDAGGFCADEFSSTHVEAYAGAAFLAGAAAACVSWAVCATLTRTAAVTASAAAISLVAAMLVEV